MRKRSKTKKISPEQALEFLEDFRKLQSGIDEKTQLISLRVPQNILRSYKILAVSENRPYQRMMIEALRSYLKNRS